MLKSFCFLQNLAALTNNKPSILGAFKGLPKYRKKKKLTKECKYSILRLNQISKERILNWFGKLDQSFIQLPREISENPSDFFLTSTEVQALLKIISHEKDWIIPSKNLCGSLRTSQRVRDSLKNKGWLDYKVIRGRDDKGKFFTAGIVYDLSPLEKEIYIRRGILSGESRTLREIKERLLTEEKSYEKQSVLFNSKIRTFIDSLSAKEAEKLKTVIPDFIRIRYYIPSRYEFFKWCEKYDIKLLEKYPSYIKYIFDRALKQNIFLPFEIKRIMKNKEALDFFISDTKKTSAKEETEDFVFKDEKEENDFLDMFMNLVSDSSEKGVKAMKNTTDYHKFGISDDTWRNIIRCFPMGDNRRRISEKTIKDILKVFEEKKVDVNNESDIINALYYPIKNGELVPEYDVDPETQTFDVYDFLISCLKRGITYASWETNKEIEKYFISYEDYSNFIDFLISHKDNNKLSKEEKEYFVSMMKKLKNVHDYCDRSFCCGLFYDFERRYLDDNKMITAAAEFRNKMAEEREACWEKIMEKGNFFNNLYDRIDALDKFIYMSFNYTATLGERLYGAKIYYHNLAEQLKEKIYGIDKFSEIKETKEYKNNCHYELYCKELTKENHYVEYGRRYQKIVDDYYSQIKDDNILWKGTPYQDIERRCGEKLYRHYGDFIYDVFPDKKKRI